MVSFIAAVCFIWVGFLLAISFMESWLKFRAPGITLPLGLGIGMLVFKALNRVEMVCFVLIAVFGLMAGVLGTKSVLIPGVIIFIIIIFQSFKWLPAMNNRAAKIKAGENLPKSNLHYYYVGAEFIKLILLIYLGVIFLKLV